MEHQSLTDYWQSLQAEFLSYVKNKNLCKDSTKLYARAFKRLLNYATANRIPQYTPEVGEEFLKIEDGCGYKGKTTIVSRYGAIRHLEILLFEQPVNNKILRKKPVFKNPRQRLEKIPLPLPAQFAQEIEEYLNFLRYSHYRESTIMRYRDYYLKMLLDFDSQGIKNWSEIKAKNLTDAFKRSLNKIQFYYRAKHLFKYLVAEKIVPFNYSGVLPRMTIKQGIPSVYTRDEIDVLLNGLDRTTAEGKRNYAIILLGVRLGIRARDISLLRFGDVNFENSFIAFVQQKTSVPQKLSLPKDVENALLDYIDNGRGESNEQYIFLDNFSRPLVETSVPLIVSNCFKNSEIDIGMRKHGAHALRMTFASELIEENVPYDAVRVLLGHVNPNSTKQYVQLTLKKLRQCALEVPVSSGLFERYLKGEIK